MTAFVSYSEDPARVGQLVETLRRHGLRTWRDKDQLGLGSPNESQIVADLERCTAAMLWLGGKTMDSVFVRTIELPKIFTEHRAQHPDRPAVRRRVRDPRSGACPRGHRARIAAHNGHVFDPNPGQLQVDLNAVAAKEVLATLQRAAQRRCRSATDRPDGNTRGRRWGAG